MSTISVFGYGSLINEQSMRQTSPNAQNIRPAYITGFVRRFNIWDHKGKKMHDDVYTPYCAVDIQPGSAPDMVNGVVFDVDQDEFQRLIEREYSYQVLETTVYDFETDKPIGVARVFSAQLDNGTFDYGNPAQEAYLQTCLDGSRTFGDRFYQMFLDTTYIDNQPLRGNKRLKNHV